jgi:hypothetical protein
MGVPRNIRYIKSFINSAEKELDKLWSVLESLKTYSTTKTDKNSAFEHVADFQVELAKVLFKVEHEYQFNAKTHMLLKRSRRTYKTYGEYRALDVQCKQIKEVLDAMISFGRSLGDAFAWPFYSKEQDVLMSHYRQQPSRMAVTTGGWCELEFIKTRRFINDQIVIYHNITNMLRIGDVSMWGGPNKALTGIGEIKSKKLDGGKVNVQLEVLGHKKIVVPFPVNAPTKKSQMTYANDDRHRKQLQKIVKTFEYLDHTNGDTSISRYDFDSYYSKINQAIKTTDKCTLTLLDRGLILICSRNKQERFADRILGADFQMELDQRKVSEKLDAILTARRYNEILFRTIHYRPDRQANIVPGTRPLFWSGLDLDVLKDIYYGKVHLFTYYNPGHLMCDIESLGFDFDEKGMNFIRRMEGGMQYRLEGFPYFIKMTSEALHPEGCVLEIVSKTKEMLDTQNQTQPIQANIRMYFQK